MKRKKERIEFAQALQGAIDSCSSGRADWAYILGVSEPAITQWVKGNTVPTAQNLRSLWLTLLEDTNAEEERLRQLDEAMSRPAEEVVPNWNRQEGSVEAYLVGPVRQAFLELLDALEPHLQEETLLQASAAARELARRKPRRPTVDERRAALFEEPPENHIDPVPMSENPYFREVAASADEGPDY